MTLFTAALLLGAGVLAGLLASIIGGAAVVVYPAMIMAGVPPQAAAVSNLVAIMPATMLAALSDRSQLPPFNRAFIGLIFASVLGAGAGAALLLATPERLFNVVIPLLLGFATLLFAFAEKIGAALRARAAGRGHDITFNVSSLKVLLPVSFYGGYFGAGVGILILGVFSLATGGDYRSANVAKNFVSSLNGFVASARVHRARRGGVAADAGADGRYHRRRACRRPHRARDPAPSGARDGGRGRRRAYRYLRAALLVLKRQRIDAVRELGDALRHRALPDRRAGRAR